MPAPKTYSANELAEKLGSHRETILSVLQSLGVKPATRKRRNAHVYPVPKSKMEEVKAALKARQGGGQSELPLDLKEAKLAEEVEHLKLKNRKLRDEATPNYILAKIFGSLATFTASYLTQKLEVENPVQTAGLEPAEIREINKKTNDEIRARYDSEFAKWEKYVEEQTEDKE